MTKMLLAALLGGIAMFMWDGLAHEVLPLGEAGVRGIDNEAAFVNNVKDNIKESGLYIYPGGEMFKPGLSAAEKQQAVAKATAAYKNGPAGILVVNAQGIDLSARLYITQCILDILALLVAVFLLGRARLQSFGARVMFVTLIGLIPTLNAEMPYWNWYSFPTTFVLAQGIGHLGAFLVGGLVAAALVKPQRV